MEDLRYIYSVARVRVLEARLLKKEIFLNMLAAGTLDMALKILTETASYALDILNIRNSKGVNEFIDAQRKKLERLASELFIESSLFEAYVYLKKDLWKSYFLILQTRSDFLKDFIKRFVDLYNIKTFLRMRYQKQPQETLKINLLKGGYIPIQELINRLSRDEDGIYEAVIKDGTAHIDRDGDFSVLEREIDNYLINLMRPVKYMSFGPEALFGYCLAKENELKNLRLILLGRINNILPLMIQERLTQAYV